MKITTLNSKNPNYTENHEIYVGTHTGSFKKLFVGNENPYIQENLQNIANLTKDCRVSAIAYGDENNSEILIGRSNKFVQVYSAVSNEFCSNIELKDGPIVGIGRYNGKIIGGLATGKIQMLQDPESIILTTGDNMSRMRQCSVDRRLVASGGKERQNNLKIFNLEIGTEIFKTKNLPNDYLQLEVPVWDSDLGFIDANVISTCSRYGYVRLYDIRAQRRPIQKYSTEEQMSFCSLMAHGNFIYTGTTMGIAKAFDIRKFKNFLHTYKGFTGSVSDLCLDDSGKYLASASLDRYVRVHHTDSCVMMYQCYVKSKATRILLRNVHNNGLLNNDNVADDSCIFLGEEKYDDDSDDEYNEIFEKMPIICENDEENKIEQKTAVKRKSSLTTKNLKISNGHEAESSQFPWQVSLKINLKNNETAECSGTLLSPNWVITAATCVRDMINVTLGFGSIEWNHPKQTIISDIAIMYEPKGLFSIRPESHDIALIKMNQSVNITTNNIKPILLPGADQTGLSFEGVIGASAGWGLSSGPHCNDNLSEEINDVEDDNNTTCLNWTEMNILSNNDCIQIYGSTITDNKLCARWLSGSNLCGNDFGGSLVILEPEGWKIIAIASYAPSCISLQPAIYSRITKYMTWISDTTGIELEYY